jgi:hypothetical protein
MDRMPVEGEWRCGHCGNSDQLEACAGATVSGKLLPDGSVTESDSSQHTLFEDSIQCNLHPQGPDHLLERWFDGAWTRWVPCTHAVPDRRDGFGLEYRCDGGAWVRYGQTLGRCPECDGEGGHWRPLVDALTERES